MHAAAAGFWTEFISITAPGLEPTAFIDVHPVLSIHGDQFIPINESGTCG